MNVNFCWLGVDVGFYIKRNFLEEGVFVFFLLIDFGELSKSLVYFLGFGFVFVIVIVILILVIVYFCYKRWFMVVCFWK